MAFLRTQLTFSSKDQNKIFFDRENRIIDHLKKHLGLIVNLFSANFSVVPFNRR